MRNACCGYKIQISRNIYFAYAQVFDTRDISIKSVTLLKDGSNLDYTLGEPVLTFGQPLKIKLPAQDLNVVITYETSPKCSALQWLDAEQTSGKEHPFLFSQCQVKILCTHSYVNLDLDSNCLFVCILQF
jgi:hypothetical protein